MSNIKVDTIELPAHWASIYINGDTSGMEPDDIEQAMAELADLGAEYPNSRIVDCGETFIGRYNGLLTEMVEYTFHYDAPADEPTAPVSAPDTIETAPMTDKEWILSIYAEVDGNRAAFWAQCWDNGLVPDGIEGTDELLAYASPTAPAEQYRILIVPDCEPYEIGDAEENDREQIEADIERYGVWGFVVEKQVDCTSEEGDCGEPHWEHVDSCFGFIGNDDDYMMSQALESIHKGYGEVSIVDGRGREINKVWR